MQVVYETLQDLEIKGKPVITAFNKTDLLEGSERLYDGRAEQSIRISAQNGENTEQLLDIIEDILQKQKIC